ncbi:MAG: acetyl-CoA carboxylase biotin carboxyl carrier protein [Gammaproteobacteria bacterium]|nr:acetyl-CoA carboxylase biotin carboxyl carrier protein [Gammaproteobacteria bacterium]
MDIRKVKKLIELLEESGINELEITEGEEAVRISRYPVSDTDASSKSGITAPPIGPVPLSEPEPAAVAPAAQPTVETDAQTVKAPMVGTFYAGPSPGSDSFVDIGVNVSVGQTLCIIEAMKMLNQIEADRAGRITAILARNGEPVEYAQPLFVIE